MSAAPNIIAAAPTRAKRRAIAPSRGGRPWTFYVLAALGLLGVMLTLLVPIARRTLELHTMRIEPTPQAGPDKVAAAVAPTT